MKHTLIITCLFTAITGMHSIANASNDIVFERVDEQEEQERLLSTFQQDKERATDAISNTKTQIRLSQSKPYLPELYLRLAELYIEKARLSYMEKRVQQGPNGSALSTLEAENLKIQAVETYQRILNVYPDFDMRDKVHFYLAHEYRDMKKTPEMEAEYLALIKAYPTSPYAPEAQLMLADFYAGDNNPQEAERRYKAVLNYSDHPARIVARYKLAWLHINRKEFSKAIPLLETSIRDAQASQSVDIDSYNALDIRLESLMDLAFIYPEHFKKTPKDHAVNYFRSLSWSLDVYQRVLEKLGRRLAVKNDWEGALEAFRTLARIHSDPIALVRISDQLFEAYDKVRSISPNKQVGSADDVAALIKAIRYYQATPGLATEDKAATIARFEKYSRDISTSIHKTAKAKKDANLYRASAKAYQSYLSFFSDAEAAGDLQINLANSLYNSKQYFLAGKTFELLTHDEKMAGERLSQYLYNATQSYYLALQNPDSLNHYKTIQARAGLISTGLRHFQEFPQSKYSARIYYNVGWTKYNEGKFSEAAAMMHSFISRYPSLNLTDSAVATLIDALQVTEEFALLQRQAQELSATKGLSGKNQAELLRVASVAQSKIVSAMTAKALDDWDDGKEALMNYADQHESSALGEQTLLSLIASSKEKSDLQTFTAAATNYLRKYPGSQEADNTAKVLIDTQLKSGQYRSLIETMNMYGEINKTEGRAFQIQAAQFAQELGNYEQSTQWINSLLGKKVSSAELSDLALTRARNQLTLGKTDEALKGILAVRSKLSSSKRLEIDAMAGHLFVAKGDSNNSAKLYNSLIKTTGGKATGNGEVNTLISELGIQLQESGFRNYQNIQLHGGIDPAVIEQKSAMMNQLIESYQRIAAYQSPEQTAQAMYRIAKVNQGFAEFLTNAPVPAELSGADKKQYVSLIAEQAAPYQQEADSLVDAADDILNTFPVLNRALNEQRIDYVPDSNTHSFAASATNTRAVNALTDKELLQKHEEMLTFASQYNKRKVLIEQYLAKSDYGVAKLLAQTGLELLSDLSNTEKAELMNYIGVAEFNMGRAQKAYPWFKQAVESDKNFFAAAANASAMLYEFGSEAPAQAMKSNLKSGWQNKTDNQQLIAWVSNHRKQLK